MLVDGTVKLQTFQSFCAFAAHWLRRAQGMRLAQNWHRVTHRATVSSCRSMNRTMLLSE